jgi:class 3 adenylate cyclase
MSDPLRPARDLADEVLWGRTERVTLAQIAVQVGLPEPTVRLARRMLGFPDPGDEPRCNPMEADAFRALAGGIAIFGDDLALEFTRVMGMAAATVAEGAIALFSRAVRAPMEAAGLDEDAFARVSRDATESFVMVCRAVDVAMRMHFEAALGRMAGPVHELPFAIAFVDLVDSTALAANLEFEELAGGLRDFDRRAAECAAAHDVRLVKLLGDAAMFAGREVRAVAGAASDLLAHAGRDDRLRGARGGLAFGPVAARDGDYFGRPVNLAARAAAVATTGELLVDPAAAADLGRDVETPRPFRLKGFEEPVPLARLCARGGGDAR